jgi:signal transduction histidine kinase/ActR/RegA family two-component response regulator
MRRISKRASQYLRDELLNRQRFIALEVNAQRKIVSVNRSTPEWKLPGLNRGSELPESLSSLVEAAFGADEPSVFHYVEVGDFIVDVHVIADATPANVVLHDVTKAHAIEQALQQKAHDNSLLSDQLKALNQELSELNQELVLRRRQAEKASNAKSRFIASMSHEFRSPIASIMGYADRLHTDFPDSEHPAALQRASWHLLTLVENLLEQARDGDDTVQLNPTRFSLGNLAKDIRALFLVQAGMKELDFAVNLSPGDMDVELDELRLRQILINLVSNALRYTQKGRVNVRLHHGDDTLLIEVEDTGLGIAEEDLETIFEPFTHVGGGNTTGTGLGLTITRQLVKRMDGKLKVASEPGVGSKFTVSIPCKQVSDSEDQLPPLQGSVLWVDDDQDILSLYEVLLTEWGLQVHTAGSLSQARTMMQRHACPVVVSDMHLTDGNGLDLLRCFKDEHPKLQAIVISGSGVSALGPGSSVGGVRAFLQKPIDPDLLYRELAAAFKASVNAV